MTSLIQNGDIATCE